MNKKIVPLFVLLLLMTCVVSVFATTEVEVDVEGDDIDVSIDVTYGDDASAYLEVGADWGSVWFKGIDHDNNPYNYGVDSTQTSTTVEMEGDGGYLEFGVSRDDSYSPMYGDAGQYSDSYLGFYDGEASFGFRTSTNYASLVSSNWGFQANAQFEVDAEGFGLGHYLEANEDEFAYLEMEGTGYARVDYMADGYTRGDYFNFGTGDGCYENADVEADGEGWLEIYGQADNNLWAHDGSWSIGGGTHTESWTYDGDLTVDDYAISGN